MKKLILLSIWGFVSFGFLYLANCSKPLDIDEIIQAPPDTVFVSDTIIFTDTLYSDTTFVDTLFIDTTFVDTIYQEIVWMLFNQEGLYQLEFLAITERIRSSQTLVIDIDGQSFSWRPADNNELLIEQNLDQYAAIRIISVPPHAYGQAIDICPDGASRPTPTVIC